MASPAKRLIPEWFPLAGTGALVVVCSLAFALFLADARRLRWPATPPLGTERVWVRPADAGELRAWVLDIGQGDAIFLETPGGKQVLVDGGADDAVLAKLGALMPPTDRTLDAVIPTHPDADHIAGLVPVLARYDVLAVYETGLTKDTRVAEALAAGIRDEGAARHVVGAGGAFEIDGVSFEVLWPDGAFDGASMAEPNRAGIVLLVRYGDASLLLTADTEAAEEAAYASRAGDVDVLKAGHHGSRTSSSRALLDAVSPEVAVISCGEDNRYGHPHPEVLARYEGRGIRTFRTDRQGDILIRADGGEPVVEPAPLPF